MSRLLVTVKFHNGPGLQRFNLKPRQNIQKEVHEIVPAALSVCDFSPLDFFTKM